MPHASQWLIRTGAVALVITLTSGALAQNTKSGSTSPAAGPASPPAATGSPATGPSPQMQGRFAAPIGHRQPTRAEVPDADRSRAGSGFDDLDAKLRICRGC